MAAAGGEERRAGPIGDFTALFAAAKAARGNAYAPYSGFAVGAALLDDGGGIHLGCNVENAAYPQSQCAEATAVGALATTGARKIVAACVVAERIGGRLTTPCGGCRQRLREFAAPDAIVFVADPTGAHEVFTMAELLPASFSLEGR